MKFATAAIGAALALGSLLPATADAQQLAYAATTLNLRAGPDPVYPVVAVVPAGAQVAVQGCLANYSWCDVIAGYSRGWVYAPYLNYPYQGAYVALPTVAGVVGLAILAFTLDDYWSAHYRGRPWYAQRYRYAQRVPSQPLFAAPAPRTRVVPAPAPRHALVPAPAPAQRQARIAPRIERPRQQGLAAAGGTRAMGGAPAVQRPQGPARVQGPARAQRPARAQGPGHGEGRGHGRGGRD